MAPQPVSPGTRTQHLYPFGKTASAPAWQVCVRGCVCVGACLCVCVREHVYVICVGVAFHLLCAHDLCARTHTRHHTHNESHKYAENMTNRHVEQVGGFQITQKRPWGSPDMCGAHARVERGTDRYRDGSPPSDSHVRPQTRRAVSAVSASSPPEQGSVWSVLGSRSQTQTHMCVHTRARAYTHTHTFPLTHGLSHVHVLKAHMLNTKQQAEMRSHLHQHQHSPHSQAQAHRASNATNAQHIPVPPLRVDASASCDTSPRARAGGDGSASAFVSVNRHADRLRLYLSPRVWREGGHALGQRLALA